MALWKVFIPQELLVKLKENSYFLGYIRPANQTGYLTAASYDALTAFNVCEDSGLQLIGKLTGIGQQLLKPLNRPIYFHVLHVGLEDIDCYVVEHGQTMKCTAIIYSLHEFLTSDLIKSKQQMEESIDIVNLLIKELNVLGAFIKNNLHGQALIKPCDLRHHIDRSVWPSLISFWMCVYFPFAKNTREDTQHSMLGNLIDPPTFVTQLRLRSNKFTSVRTNRYENTVNSKETSNLCVGQVLDTMLGLACMWILMSNGTAQWLANIGLAYGDKTAEGLKELLDWLMGAPAGLKLNSQLTHFLGKFFQYHIYLWTVYLSIIRPVLGSLLFYSSLSGVLGLTFQLALLQDILATMTVHIYCFYVYAARLYRLQIYALGSLWRLFRGKKWNVLRQRVDSAVYDVDQLFVGTLLFTVLLFILPTSALYYVVFTLLRILVLVIQGLLTRVRSILDTTPWWSVLQWLVNRQCLVDGAYLTTHTSSKSNNLVLYMHGTRPSLSTVLSSCREPTSGSPYTWATILKNLIHGHLIYPWIEMKQS